ncbi:MAG: hypothetical protein GQ474_10575 [Sulfurimonas sp.]|nr:hypothetical protein [Sulfurimonas sp.]
MELHVGKIVAVHDRHVDVELYSPKQLIKNVVRVHPIDLDEREEQAKVNIGTETLLMIDDLGSAYAMGSISQGIVIAKNATTRIQNDTNLLYAQNTTISAPDGETAIKAEVNASTIKLTNGTDDLIDLVSQLCTAVANSAPTSGSSSGSANSQKSTAEGIKAKVDAFK